MTSDFFQNNNGTIVSGYPEREAGYKRDGTSKEAASSINSDELSLLKRGVLKALKAQSMTADEIAGQLGLSILTIRPRCSELLRMGKIKETDQRRPNASGKMAAVLRAI